MTKESQETQSVHKSFELWITVVTLIIGGVIYAFAALSYVHANFLTRSEADTRKEARDKTELSTDKKLDRIEGKLDILLLDRSHK